MSPVLFALMPDVMTTWRGSPAALVHRVDQLVLPDECDTRETPGICWKHWLVVCEPAPLIVSSPPDCTIVTVPPGAPLPEGFSPHPSPHSDVFQLADMPDALHVPESVGTSSARAALGHTSAIETANRAAIVTRARMLSLMVGGLAVVLAA
ncbi:MAG: hypothetical protein U0414_20590 [Polyangiaceae bacterium]